MAKKQSALAGRLGKALKKHANDETNYGVDLTDPPPGITGGIAQLTSATIGEYKSGKYQGEKFCRMAGSIISPKKHTYSPRTFSSGKIVVGEPTTVDVAGLFTSIMIPLCDTVKGDGTVVDMEEHVAAVENELRKLGADTSELESEEDLVALLEALVEAGPYFRFGTSSGDPTKDYPTPRTWQNWYGSKGLEDYTTEDMEDEVEDATEEEEDDIPFDDAEESVTEEEEDEGQTLEELADAADGGDEAAQIEIANRAKGCGVDPEDERYATWTAVATAIEGGGDPEASEEEEDESDDPDVIALGNAADKGDEDAIDQLTSLAEEQGLDPNDYPDSWLSMAETMTGDAEEKEAGEEEEEDVYVPEKGDTILYKPKGARKSIECNVLTVNNSDSTSTIQSLDDGKKYSNVPWSAFVI